MKPWGAPVENKSPDTIKSALIQRGKIMLLGVDANHILQRRFHAAGYAVFCAGDRESALDIAHHQRLDAVLLLSQDSLVNVAETIFNLRDLCPAAKIIVLLPRGAKTPKRFLRQMLNHRIAGSEIMTRRELRTRSREPDFLIRQKASASGVREQR